MTSWNIDETPYPGPFIEYEQIFCPGNDYNVNNSGSFIRFTCQVARVPRSSINDWVEVCDYSGRIIFEGYLNNIEVESSFWNRAGSVTSITVTNKQVATEVVW